VEGQAALQLDLERLTTEMERQEIGAIPVVAEANGGEAEVGRYGRNLLEVIVFLLTGVQLLIRYKIKHKVHHSTSRINLPWLMTGSSPTISAPCLATAGTSIRYVVDDVASVFRALVANRAVYVPSFSADEMVERLQRAWDVVE